MPPPTPLRARPIEEAIKNLLDTYGGPIPKEYEEQAKESGRPVEFMFAKAFSGSKKSRMYHAAKEYLIAYDRLPEVKKALKEALKAAKKKNEEEARAASEPHLLHSPRKGE